MEDNTFLLRRLFKTFLEHRIFSRWSVLFIDLLMVTISTFISYFITLSIYNNIPALDPPVLYQYMAFTVGITFFYFLVIRTYVGIIRYSTISEVQRCFVALSMSAISVFLYLFFVKGSPGSISLPYSLLFLLFTLLGLSSFRFSVRSIYRYLQNKYSDKVSQVFIWGVDEESVSVSQLLNATQSVYNVKGFIENRSYSKYSGNTELPIIKKESDFLKYRVKNVLFVNNKIFRENKACAEELIKKGINIYITDNRNINNLNDLTEASQYIRPIQIEDLLGRPEIKINEDTIFESVNNRVVLVSGAAGSIGSEIIRQLSLFTPKLVICVDQAESPLHELSLELNKTKLNFKISVTDIRNLNKLSGIFEEYKPEIVFHAAAYKHVPLMEEEPSEAIMTNVEGTKHMVDLSVQHNIRIFVMISTDKAVNPTNVMGTSKRIAEIYTQSCALDLGIRSKTQTKFITTRFGNVLGSNGSVIPLFKKQIQDGGPVTVTHKDITRYFMTIPEACRLVLEASVIGESGYIYVFDMGEPIRIYDMAKKMIELSGLRVHRDIAIEFSGLRPGEKLYEELLSDLEATEDTSHSKIRIAKVREYTLSKVSPQIDDLIRIAKCSETDELVKAMKLLVPEYISQNSKFMVYDHSLQTDLPPVENGYQVATH